MTYSTSIRIVNYDPDWPNRFQAEAEKIRTALGPKVLRLEHTGSTSVPGLAAKPIVDMLLVVANSADENSYAPALEAIGFTLCVREPEWHEHRMFKGSENDVNLHVFSDACSEIDRVLLFRDWLRGNAADRDLYARTKLALAQMEWQSVDDYARAKTGVIEEILRRAMTR